MGGTHRGGHGLWLTHLKNDLKTLKVWGEKNPVYSKFSLPIVKEGGNSHVGLLFPTKACFPKD